MQWYVMYNIIYMVEQRLERQNALGAPEVDVLAVYVNTFVVYNSI